MKNLTTEKVNAIIEFIKAELDFQNDNFREDKEFTKITFENFFNENEEQIVSQEDCIFNKEEFEIVLNAIFN